MKKELAEQSYAGVCKATTYQEYLENKTNLIQFPYALNYTGKDIVSEEDWFSWDRGVDAFFNPIEVIEQTTIPVLAFFGEKDTQVDPFQGAQAYEQALQKAGNQNYRAELIPGVAHVLALAETGCMNEHRARVYAPEHLDLMEEWLVQLPTPLPPLSGSDGGRSPSPPNGSQIAFSSNRSGNYDIYIMNLADALQGTDGTNLQRLTQNPAVDAQPTWSPDGTQIAFVSLRDGSSLASGGTDPTVRLWDVASGQVVHTLRHQDGLMSVAFSPDGTILAAAGVERTVQLWDVESGRALRSLPHDDELMAVAFSPDGTLLASGGYDNQVYLWGIPR